MKKLLVIAYVWPEPVSSAAGSRMMQLIDIMQKLSYQVIYASPAQESEYMVKLDELGIKQVKIELNNSSFDQFVSELKPDVVLFDRFMMEEQFSWRVDNACPEAVKILETVDLHCLRYARHQAVKSQLDANDYKSLNFYNEIALREVASIIRCDLSLIISKIEMDVLKDIYHVNEDCLLYLPFMYEKVDQGNWPAYTQRKHFVTIGNFRHEPNWDSVLYLKNTVWPGIRARLKDAELHIYGSYLPKKAMQLNNEKQGFIIKGRAEDASETLKQYRCCLSPLRFGAGMKGKLVDAMLTGTPSITTSIGAESMHADYEWPGFVKDNDADIIAASIELYNDENIWQKKQDNIAEIMVNVFNKNKYTEKFTNKLDAIVASVQQLRQQNFTAMMLRYHTVKSAQYMSQWIEAKNKLK